MENVIITFQERGNQGTPYCFNCAVKNMIHRRKEYDMVLMEKVEGVVICCGNCNNIF